MTEIRGPHDANASAPDQPFLFDEMLPVAEEACPLVRPHPRAFERREHRDEVSTTHTIDGIVRMTWTCRTCGNVRGRV